MTTSEAPLATVRPARSSRWLWLIPVVALVFALTLLATYAVKRGPVIAIRLTNGYGIKPTDVVRCRGIVVGQVEQVKLTDDLGAVELSVRLDPAAKSLARTGSRFWVVRPAISFSGASGLDTIAGPRYLAVVPGEGEPQSSFIALDEPPVVDALDPDGLEITLVSPKRGGIRAGSPIMYRQVRIGTVLSVALSGDAASVEARGYIRPAYASLVRDNSRFWSMGTAQMELSLTGMRVAVESLETLVEGGVALATPDAPGSRVNTGHRFLLATAAEDEWQKWRPHLPIGSDLLPSGATLPPVVRVSVRKSSNHLAGLWSSVDLRKGWLIITGSGAVGPASLLASGGTLEVAGQRIDLAANPGQRSGELIYLPLKVPGVATLAPESVRTMEKAEECLIFTDTPDHAIAVTANRLRRDKAGWWIDPSLPLEADLAGAAVVARSDGKVVGVLTVQRNRGWIEPLPTSK